MQTFLPYADFAKSASVLDNKRLGKQRVEVLQILNALTDGPFQEQELDTGKWVSASPYDGEKRKTPWYNHPATQMWKGYETGLHNYGAAICKEWIKRGFKDTCLAKISKLGFNIGNFTPPWLGRADFHASHRAALLAKDYNHYSQFGWTEKPALNYIWPAGQ